VNQGMSETAASKRLEGTESGDKNEILWAEFGKNYNKEPDIFRKGTVIYREVHSHIPQANCFSRKIESSRDRKEPEKAIQLLNLLNPKPRLPLRPLIRPLLRTTLRRSRRGERGSMQRNLCWRRIMSILSRTLSGIRSHGSSLSSSYWLYCIAFWMIPA